MTRHLRRLGNQFNVSFPLDSRGYLGRECPEADCKRYFKIKPGTGLKGENLPCHCPYCGDEGAVDTFHTPKQIKYAESVVFHQVHKAVVRDLKDMARDFNRRTRGGLFSLKMDVKPSPSQLRQYVEAELETHVQCAACGLEYAVFGIFAFCPDCGTHNSLQILEMNLELVEEMLALSDQTGTDVADQLIENALEDCVSALDGFGREVCRIHAKYSTNPGKAGRARFQNLEGAKRTVFDLFGHDLSVHVSVEEWQAVNRAFQKRHLIAHKMGVVDQEYITKKNDPDAVVGRKISVAKTDVQATMSTVRKIARGFAQGIAAIRNEESR